MLLEMLARISPSLSLTHPIIRSTAKRRTAFRWIVVLFKGAMPDGSHDARLDELWLAAKSFKWTDMITNTTLSTLIGVHGLCRQNVRVIDKCW